MKKSILIMLVALLTVAVAAPAFAAPWANGGWNYGANLTEEQKAQINKMNQQLFEERKQMIERRIEWGYLTREQADWQISNLQERMAYANEYGLPLFGGGYYSGMHGGGGYYGGGRRGGGGWGCGGGGGCW